MVEPGCLILFVKSLLRDLEVEYQEVYARYWEIAMSYQDCETTGP